MKIPVYCKTCPNHHFDHHICRKCKNTLREPLLDYWNKEQYEKLKKETIIWKFCPYCGEPLYENI